MPRRRRYRSYADQIYSDAIRYTSNVVRVYSPNATAAKVQAAVAGASIIVYLGHGNGWPSPYTYDPAYTTKDGFGLNYDSNGDGKTTDYENKYYGEPWIRALRPAPNAVVLLFHLCYASGNPESGAKEPTLSNATKRVDNYAAAFIQAGARAVIANGHSHDPYYIGALFTTRQTMDEYWRNAPDAHGNVTTYDSVRNPGYTFQLDPESPGYYYRSIAGKMSLRTQDVTGAPYADTAVDPPALVVPGNAAPAVDGAPVYGSVEAAQAGTAPIATLPEGDEGARRRPRAGHRVGRPVPDLPRPHLRCRGLDDRLVAGAARQHGATGLGGERRDRCVLAQRRWIAGQPQGGRPPVRVRPVDDARGQWRRRCAGQCRGHVR